MELQTLTELSYIINSAAIAALVIALYTIVPIFNYRSQLAKLPSFSDSVGSEKHRQEYLRYAKKLYNEGYEKFRNRVYRMATTDGDSNVVVPLELLPELRKLPEDVLSFMRSIDEIMEAKYTHFLTDTDIIVHSVKADLTPALSRLNTTVADEVDAAIREYMPPCEEWTSVPVYKTIVDIVAKVTGRVFVGPELSKHPVYLDSAINYTVDLMTAVDAIKKVRPFLRPLLAPRLPQVRRLREKEKQATEYLRPIIQERQEAAKNDPNWQPPDDMLQWMLNREEQFNVKSADEFVRFQLGLIFAAIHTTSTTATSILYTLAVTPDYIAPLREEIRQVMADNDDQFTTRALQKMEKLDSYMKECIRVHNSNITSFNRRVLKGITLSNGQYLPAGITIEVPSHAIHQDPTFYPNGSNFDGFRHYRQRHGGTVMDAARNQFVTTNETNLNWGYGRHACPGRFFATNEIKIILARLLAGYDLEMPGGAKERYPSIDMGKMSVPDPTKMLMFKRVVN